MIDLDGNQLRAPLRVTSYGAGAKCSVEGCGNRPKAGGLCAGHWQRQKKRRPLDTPLGPQGRAPGTVLCCIAGCERRANNRGMCQPHAAQRARGFYDDQGNKLREPYKGGKKHIDGPILNGYGYVLVRAPEGYQGRTRDGRVLEHRFNMEQKLGRLLEDWELVHHKDGVRTHNDISNLELLDGRARRGEGHPPGHSVTKEDVQLVLDHLKLNDPQAYEEVRTLFD